MTDNVTELPTGPAVLDKAALLAAASTETFETDDVAVPGFGVLTVRGLSRSESQHFHASYRRAVDSYQSVAPIEAWLIATASVKPTFTETEVKKLQGSPLGEHLEAIVDAVTELSGYGGDAGPEATDQFPD